MKKNFLFVYFGILTLTSCIISSADEIEGHDNLEKAFTNSFGFRPTNDIEDIKARTKSIGDSYIFWLRVTYNKDTFTKILKKKTFSIKGDANNSSKKIWYANEFIFFDNLDGPKWYAIPKKDLPIYYGKGQESSFSLCAEAVWIDENKQYIYYINVGQN